VVVWVGGSGRALELLNEAGIPTYADPSRAVDAVGALVRYSAMRRWRSERAQPGAGATTRRPERAARARQLLDRLRGDGRTTLMEHEAKEVLALYGLPFPAERVARSAEEAVAAATAIGFPVALKIIAREVVHKSEMGGVRLGLAEPEAVRQAYDQIVGNLRQRAPGAQLEGVLVSAMAPPGAEVLVGLKRDPVFGPVVLVGLGGILVEVLRDVSLRVIPIDGVQAGHMLDELRGQAVLKGVRGQPPRDREALIQLIRAVSAVAEELGDEIQELDLNPVIVGPAGVGALVVDAAMIVQPMAEEAGNLRMAPAD
jgi:acyl-CoA synthetase (NDP forming)